MFLTHDFPSLPEATPTSQLLTDLEALDKHYSIKNSWCRDWFEPKGPNEEQNAFCIMGAISAIALQFDPVDQGWVVENNVDCPRGRAVVAALAAVTKDIHNKTIIAKTKPDDGYCSTHRTFVEKLIEWNDARLSKSEIRRAIKRAIQNEKQRLHQEQDILCSA